jgi:hypothetical protein
MRRSLLVGSLAATVLLVLSFVGTVPAGAAPTPWFDSSTAATVTVASGPNGPVFRDGYGREVVLRGFNVSGETKLKEHSLLPFADVADAKASAAAMRRLTGANTVRFLIAWEGVQPAPKGVDTAYLSAATAQLGAFLDAGFRVVVDFHQDLYSRHLFTSGSWYTGNGAPKWVIDGGGYPAESCGICFQWGQNMKSNTAVTRAIRDFWHNRTISTPAGQVAVQDAYVRMTGDTMAFLKANLTAAQFAGVVGLDPFNEPFPGGYDSGQDAVSWERDLLWPFYRKVRAVMDSSGWAAKPALIEPLPFWNVNLSFFAEPGGFGGVPDLGPRYVFNTHFYDAAELSGLFMWGNAASGRYADDFAKIRSRAAGLGTAAIVTEFGSPLSGSVASKTPSVYKALFQSLDSTKAGPSWWNAPTASGTVLSGTAWQWDVHSGRHRELMNGNQNKPLTEADAWNGEDFSLVARDASGTLALRQDRRVLDRVYPLATSGSIRAFTYEDRAHDGGAVLSWNAVPSDLPNLASVAGSNEFAVLVWRSAGIAAPTELHLPGSFPAASTTVVSDLGAVTGPPAWTAAANQPITVAARPGVSGVQRLLLSATDTGVTHVALVTRGTAPSASALAAARQELTAWANSAFAAP